MTERNFKELVQSFQENGDTEIIERIMKEVEIGFNERKESPEKYIVAHILGEREKITKHAKEIFSGNEYRYKKKTFINLCSQLCRKVREIEFERLMKGDYAQLYEYRELIWNFFTYYEWDNAINHSFEYDPYYCDIETRIEKIYTLYECVRYFEKLTEQFEKRRQEIREEFMPLVRLALEYALSKVDVNHSDKEIVTYINKTWTTNFIRLGLEHTGRKVIERTKNGERVRFYVGRKWKGTYNMIFGDWIEESDLNCLNKNQLKLIKDIVNIIERDKAQGNFDNYRLDEQGYTVLNKRYVAEKLGLEESNLKHKLGRIIKKISAESKNVTLSNI